MLCKLSKWKGMIQNGKRKTENEINKLHKNQKS